MTPPVPSSGSRGGGSEPLRPQFREPGEGAVNPSGLPELGTEGFTAPPRLPELGTEGFTAPCPGSLNWGRRGSLPPPPAP